ncbi:zinc-binding alcohol dehydrogenase family protein [Massilia oculi]|nr:zinc-binding alcohol dehydrogenase family protein [Massilia oculi]
MTRQRMKAAVYDAAGGPEVLRYTGVDMPPCGPDQVLVRVGAISIEGGDLLHRANLAPEAPNHIVGFAAAGEIVEVGSAVTDRRVGQRVATGALEGSHAEFRAVRASATWIVPDGVDDAAAAAVPVAFGTAWHCVHERLRLAKGETLQVQGGAGMVGLAAIQIAHRLGARVIATVSGEERSARLRALGLDEAIDHRSQDVVAVVRELTSGHGADAVIDPVGATLAQSFEALREHGRLVFVGNAGGSLAPDLFPAMAKNLTLHGVFFGALWESPEVAATIDAILADVAADKLEVVIDRRFPLAEAAAAHRHAEQGGILGRTVMIP